MNLYRNIDTGEIRELGLALIAAWQTSGNPKALQWEQYTPPPPEPHPLLPNYIGFYDALLVSTTYTQGVLPLVLSGTSTTIGGRLLIFESQFSEARNGRANPSAMQAALWILLQELTPTPQMMAELQGLLEQFNLAGVYSLAPL